MADGKLSFYSSVRRGLATALTTPDGTPAGEPRTTIRIVVKTAEALESSAFLSLIGPGDIVGLDPSVVARVWPKPDDNDAEFIPYALIELDQADLPWRYTPAAAAGEVSSAGP